MSGIGSKVLWGLGIVFLALPLAASLGPGLVGSALKVNAPAASDLTCPGHVCPANGNKLDEQARQRQQATTATTMPVPQPYGPANGPVRLLPSVKPIAPAEPTGGRPQLEPSDGILSGVIRGIPEIGPAVEGGLKAIAPVAKP